MHTVQYLITTVALSTLAVIQPKTTWAETSGGETTSQKSSKEPTLRADTMPTADLPDAHPEGPRRDSELEAATALGRLGKEEFESGNYVSALAHLNEAYDLAPTPQLALWSARALEKRGRWVEALERYRMASRLSPPVNEAGELQSQVAQAAEDEQDALEQRIPRVTILVEGPSAELTVLAGTKVVPSHLWGTPIAVDVGSLTVLAVSGARTVRLNMTLPPGAKETVAVRTDPLTLETDAVLEDRPFEDLGPRMPLNATTLEDKPRHSAQRTAGWIGIGVGTSALVAGGITGALLLARKSQIDCENGICAESDLDAVQRYNNLRPIPVALLTVGGILTATGVVLVLTAPRKTSTAFVAPYVGLSAVGVSGAF